jgi:Lrp/AsnC family transcriptional regulator, leucine-responsive regulatory protein
MSHVIANMRNSRYTVGTYRRLSAIVWHFMRTSLDDIDRRILAALQKDGRLTNIELAKRVGLSPSPCLRRVKLLEEAGVIARYAALLDPAKVGMSMTVFCRVWLSAQDETTVRKFVDAVKKLREVVECHLMAGECDFLLRIVAADMEAYRRFQAERLGKIPGVRSMKTDIPMQQIKSSWEIPLDNA